MSKQISEILSERKSRYGEYCQVASITESIKDALKQGVSFKDLTPSQLLALDMIANKLARVVNGDVTYTDSWQDIAGYALLVVKELEKK